MSRLFVCLSVSFCLLTVPAGAALSMSGSVTAEAEGAAGARVFFTILVVGGNDGSDGRPADTVVCAPASGSLFPFGATTVSCSGSEGSRGSFVVTVADTSAPVLSLPFDFTVVTASPTGEAVTYTATASDLVDGNVPVTCTPPSGSVFPVGTTTISCAASDSRGNAASDEFELTLTTSTPPPGNPDIVAEASGPGGALVVFDTGDRDDTDGRPGSGGCSPAPGALFPLGDTLVSCPSGNFTVSVVDTTPPALALPDDITTVATGPTGVTVAFTATATDLVDGSVAVACTPVSGSLFPHGVTTVSCSAGDSRSNAASGTFEVEVTAEPVPPVNPDDITVEATGPTGAVVTFDPGQDGGGRPITCLPASGSTFPPGATEVTCSSGATFTVNVVDTTPPVLTLPSNITEEAASPGGNEITFAATADDLVDGWVPVTCVPPSGSTFELGSTTVSCSASDSHGNAISDSFEVKVVDTTPPAITSVTVSPGEIWPPNGKLVKVTVTVAVEDVADPGPLVRIYDITCDEMIAATDAMPIGLLRAELRAERDPKQDGRVYTLHIEAVDSSANRSTASVPVIVPHDARSREEVVEPPGKRRSVGRRG